MSEQDNLDVAPLWKRLCEINELPRLGSRVVKTASGDIAVFRSADDQVWLHYIVSLGAHGAHKY